MLTHGPKRPHMGRLEKGSVVAVPGKKTLLPSEMKVMADAGAADVKAIRNAMDLGELRARGRHRSPYGVVSGNRFLSRAGDW